MLASPGVTAILADRFYGQRVPANTVWPYAKTGVPVTEPFEATGWGGSDTDFTIHAFARGPDEAACAALAAAIVDAIADDDLPLEGGIGLVSLDWRGTQIISDGGESADYHAIIRFQVVTTG